MAAVDWVVAAMGMAVVATETEAAVMVMEEAALVAAMMIPTHRRKRWQRRHLPGRCCNIHTP